jgi:long-chain acyl-CoA synthetase
LPRTLIRIFLDAVSTYDSPALFMRRGERGWESIPARRALDDVECLTLGLRELGVGPGDHVALLSENRYEWPLSDLAVLGLGAATVPIYPTLTADQVRGILGDSGAKLAIVSTQAQRAKLEACLERLPALAGVIAMDPLPAGGPNRWTLPEVIERGRALRAADPSAYRQLTERVSPDDVATLIYTSGTTGEPKGAMLTHANIAFDVEACLEVVNFSRDDVYLSFLPLCHIFERMAGLYAMLSLGIPIAYARSAETVGEDAIEVRPTVMTGVPRFYEKVHARVLETVAAMPALHRRLFHWGLARGTARARAHFEGRAMDSPSLRLADRLVASRVRARMGGRLRLCISGGAPLSSHVLEFFFAMGIPILEGYGLTETSPVICLNLPGRERPGSVGPPIPGVEVRISEEGEILTRGPHVMRGYWNNEEATRAALRDGWFHTGDVGRFDRDGWLTITDRIKDIIVTAGGKKVAPQPLEALLKTSPWVAEAVLLGDRMPYVVCLIVPRFASLEAEAEARGWPIESRGRLLRSPQVLALYQGEIDRLNEGLAQFEKIKRFTLLDHELSAEAGEITPTLKVRRRVIMDRYDREIQTLYAGHARMGGPAPYRSPD